MGNTADVCPEIRSGTTKDANIRSDIVINDIGFAPSNPLYLLRTWRSPGWHVELWRKCWDLVTKARDTASFLNEKKTVQSQDRAQLSGVITTGTNRSGFGTRKAVTCTVRARNDAIPGTRGVLTFLLSQLKPGHAASVSLSLTYRSALSATIRTSVCEYVFITCQRNRKVARSAPDAHPPTSMACNDLTLYALGLPQATCAFAWDAHFGGYRSEFCAILVRSVNDSEEASKRGRALGRAGHEVFIGDRESRCRSRSY